MVKTEVAPEIVEIFESAANYLKLKTYNNKISDFKKGDIVRSNLLKGVFVIESVGEFRVKVTEFANSESVIPMLPIHLEKLTNEKVIKTLYGR